MTEIVERVARPEDRASPALAAATALSQYPLNPDYGTGTYRRRVRLNSDGASVIAILNDDFHAMWCRLTHDGSAIGDVEAEMSRFPKTTCPGAGLALRELVGMKLETPRKLFYGAERPERNCTHLLDLALLAMRHALRGEGECVIDIAIPDEIDGATRIRSSVDGTEVHDWQVVAGVIRHPSALAGLSLFSGFASFIEARFDGVVLDAARMVQKAAFVARGRRYIVDRPPALPARDEAGRLGDCYTYSPAHMAVAEGRLGYVEDFSAGVVETLPRFYRRGV